MGVRGLADHLILADGAPRAARPIPSAQTGMTSTQVSVSMSMEMVDPQTTLVCLFISHSVSKCGRLGLVPHGTVATLRRQPTGLVRRFSQTCNHPSQWAFLRRDWGGGVLAQPISWESASIIPPSEETLSSPPPSSSMI